MSKIIEWRQFRKRCRYRKLAIEKRDRRFECCVGSPILNPCEARLCDVWINLRSAPRSAASRKKKD